MQRLGVWWLLGGALILALVLPLWLHEYPPLYDYQNHLLEAQVVAQYENPRLGYAESYAIQPGWYLRSNALSTILLVALGTILPIALAGKLVLSLYLVLFVVGLALFVRRTTNDWVWLLLAPVLAYNFTFTSGWLNFAYGIALSLSALAVFLHWQETARNRDLLLLGILLLLIYVAHLVVWALVVLSLCLLAVGSHMSRQRYLRLLPALYGAVPLLLLTRPTLAVVALAIAPLVWIGALLVRTSKLRSRSVLLIALALTVLIAVAIELGQPLRERWFYEVVYIWHEKLVRLLHLLTLPPQSMPLDPVLIGYNVVLLGLLIGLVLIMLWVRFRCPGNQWRAWRVPLVTFGLLYVVMPTRTHDVWVIEPRVLLFLVISALALAERPRSSGRLRTLIGGWIACISVLSIVGTVYYAAQFDHQARRWTDQLASLQPARNVLLLRAGQVVPPPPSFWIRSLNQTYRGEHFSTIYSITHGGLHSRIFPNGPVYPQERFLIPLYYWSGFDTLDFVVRHCPALRTTYDAVLVWGVPTPALAAQLDTCFTRGQHFPDMAIWHVPTGASQP